MWPDNRLRVLLVDDNPDLDPRYGVAQELGEYVQLMWLGDEDAAKSFLDSCIWLDRLDPDVLHELVPEVVLIDYKLSRPLKGYDEFRAPVELLRQRIESLGMGRSEYDRPKVQSDRIGFLLGILIAHTFKAYPCVALPVSGITKGQPGDSLLEEFEWCIDEEYYRAFRARGSTFRLNESVKVAAASLRNKLAELARAELISISLLDLARLWTELNADEAGSALFSFESRYGRRQIRLISLFVDVLFGAGNQQEGFSKVVAAGRDWAEKLWNQTLGIPNSMENRVICESVKFSERIWQAYCRDMWPRHQLSDLVDKGERKVELASSEVDDLIKLSDRFGVEGNRCGKSLVVTDHTNDQVVRWASLMLAVRLADFIFKSAKVASTNIGEKGVDKARRTRIGVRRYIDVEKASSLELNLVWFPTPSEPLILKKANVFTASGLAKTLSRRAKITGQAVLRGECIKDNELAVLQVYAKGLGFDQWPSWLVGE